MRVDKSTSTADAEMPPARQSVPYRTAFETKLDLREATRRVHEQLRAWLREKNLDVERFDDGVTTIGPGTALLYAATNTACGWQLRERRDDGVTWVSTVAVTRAEDRYSSTWVSVNVEAIAPGGDAPAFVAPPRLIRLLLDVIDAYDGEAFLRSLPTLVSAADVDDVLDLVCAPDRRLPMVVAAAPNDVPFEQWRPVVERLTRNFPGLASSYLLDPAAVQAFNAGIGDTHWVGPGSVRTYLPDVDPAVAEDAVRHRVLSRRRIDEDHWRAARVLAVLPRQLAANSLPPAATRGLNLSIRDFTRSATTRPVSDDRTTALTEEVQLLTELLETADGSERQSQATVNRQQGELFDLAAELEVMRDEMEARDATIRALRKKLVEAGRYNDAFAVADQPSPLPKSFAELLDRITELQPYVVFTGDRGECLDLDEHAQHSTWAQLAWQGLLALAAYARAKENGTFDGDFKRWCEAPPDGVRTISAGKVARDESETVRNNRRFALMRTRPVPVEIEPSGKIFMGAHIRLGNSSTVAPRMHFYDESVGRHVIYVGYIGRHLANTLTS